MIKSVVIFGSFDASSPGFIAQADQFAGACRTALEQVSGYSCEVSNSSSTLKGKSGQPAAVKAHLKSPDGADSDEDFRIGSDLAYAVTSPLFEEALRAILFGISPYNCLIELSTNVDQAVLNGAPGVVSDEGWTPPGPRLTLTLEGSTSYGETYGAYLSEDLGVDETASGQFIVEPRSVVYPTYEKVIISASVFTNYWTGPVIRGVPGLKSTVTATNDGTDRVFVAEAIGDTSTDPTMAIDGSPAGYLSKSGTPYGAFVARINQYIDISNYVSSFIRFYNTITSRPELGSELYGSRSQNFDQYNQSWSNVSLSNMTTLISLVNTTGAVLPANTRAYSFGIQRQIADAI